VIFSQVAGINKIIFPVPGAGLVPVQQLVIFPQVAGINKIIFLLLVLVWYLFNSW
jgi:hypothetical protein